MLSLLINVLILKISLSLTIVDGFFDILFNFFDLSFGIFKNSCVILSFSFIDSFSDEKLTLDGKV